jgi:hypothetical protein
MSDATQTDEVALYDGSSGLMSNRAWANLGRLTITNERVLFFKEHVKQSTKHAPLLPQLVGHAIGARKKGPTVELALPDITGIRHAKRGLNRDMVLLSTADAEYRFTSGWKKWSPLLRETLATRHHRRLVEDDGDGWRVEPML